MSKKFFTADNHFDHENIILHCKRPFRNAQEMNEAMIERWNAVVGKNDIVYHLGDIAYRGNRQSLEAIRKRLNGQIYLVPGNHDKLALKMQYAWTILPQCAEIKIGDPAQRIVLCHYAMRVWNKSFHGAWHLYGHSHGTLPEEPTSLSFDVGVDNHNFTPLSEAEVFAKMQPKIELRKARYPHLKAADGNVYNQGLRDMGVEDV